MSATSLHDGLLLLRRGDVLRKSGTSLQGYLLRTPAAAHPTPLKVHTNDGGKVMKLTDTDLLDWEVEETGQKLLSMTTAPPRQECQVATIWPYSWSQFRFADHNEGKGEPLLLGASSTDTSNPWVMASHIRLSPYRMLFFTESKSGRPLIEHALGLSSLPSDPTGVLLRHTITGKYATFVRAEQGKGRLYVINDSADVLTDDLKNWAMAGPSRTITLGQVIKRSTHPGLLSRSVLSTRRARTRLHTMGYRAWSVAPGLLTISGSIWGDVSNPGALLAIGAFSLVTFGPSASYLRNEARQSLGTKKVSSIESSYAASPATTTPALQDPLRQRLQESLTSEHAADLPDGLAIRLRRLREVGDQLVGATSLLDQVELAEITGLLYDHLPQSLQLHQQSLTHLGADRQKADELLGQQMDLIGARLAQVQQLVKERVLAEQDKHLRFLDAKLRKSDLD